MAVSNEVILNKMMKELKQAMNVTHHERQLMTHIAHVHILCELILDQDHSQQSTSLEEKEKKVMLGQSFAKKEPNNTLTSTLLEDEDANGESIFDF